MHGKWCGCGWVWVHMCLCTCVCIGQENNWEKSGKLKRKWIGKKWELCPPMDSNLEPHACEATVLSLLALKSSSCCVEWPSQNYVPKISPSALRLLCNRRGKGLVRLDRFSYSRGMWHHRSQLLVTPECTDRSSAPLRTPNDSRNLSSISSFRSYGRLISKYFPNTGHTCALPVVKTNQLQGNYADMHIIASHE